MARALHLATSEQFSSTYATEVFDLRFVLRYAYATFYNVALWFGICSACRRESVVTPASVGDPQRNHRPVHEDRPSDGSLDAHEAVEPTDGVAAELRDLMTVRGRLFETDVPTPCRVNKDGDLWFSPFRDRERAARQCMSCPFLGRCGYNAVASRATHGVWAGEILPGDRPAELQPIYARLLTQFEQRRETELGHAPPPELPDHTRRRRRRRVTPAVTRADDG